MKIMIRLMPLFGQDPHHFGRNKDVDLTELTRREHPVHAIIKLGKESVETRSRAIACHASQDSGQQRSWFFKIVEMIAKLRGAKDYFMRVYPPPNNRRREKDLF